MFPGVRKNRVPLAIVLAPLGGAIVTPEGCEDSSQGYAVFAYAGI